MSEEVGLPEAPAEVIVPAKSEDKLEIEKEEAEEKRGQDKAEEPAEKSEEVAEEDKNDDGEDEADRKKFKLPKMPGFLRSKSKEREKNKDKSPEKSEQEENNDEEKPDDDDEQAGGKDAKTMVKDALDNIHLPKLPKLHKPAFLKKKKEDEASSDEAANSPEEAGGEASEAKDADKGEIEEAEASKDPESATCKLKKVPGFFDNFRKSQVHMPAFLSKKSKELNKDDNADQEESKELLEKKAGEEEQAEGTPADEDENKGEKKDEEKKTDQSKSTLLETIRSVASQVPSLFKGQKAAAASSGDSNKEAVDVEAGEKEELLEGEKLEGTNNELEEVKVVSEEQKLEDEKKDPEKPYCKYLSHAKAAKEACQQKYQGLERQKQLGLLALIAALLTFLFILIVIAICAPSNWTNYARISEDGKYVMTHTACGPVQGLVEGHDQFSFKGIPYAVPVLNTDRWTHSKPMTTLTDCHEGTLLAHGHNASGSCWRRFNDDNADGDENCLTLDVYTSSVVYTDLKPVVVYIGSDDLSEAEEAALQPSASLAHNHSMVFVSVNYRQGVLGFLSLDSLSQRSRTKSSGNYGLGDLVSALKWIQKNIQHFGGMPSRVTLLARGSGATLATALTASPMAKGLFHQLWVSDGAGVYENTSLAIANAENKAVLNAVNCGSAPDVVDCLIDATAEDLTLATKKIFEWDNTRMPDLPQVGEKGHSWIIIDKHVLLQHPKDYWAENQLSNNIPIVFGSNAQGGVREENLKLMDWKDADKFEAHVESKLGSFNTTLPGQAMAAYNESSDHWQAYASMVSDIRTVCPLLALSEFVSKNFVADVFSYVATQKGHASGPLGGLAGRTLDLAAILGAYRGQTEAERSFVANMQRMFDAFVRTGKLPMAKDVTLGMYVVDEAISTQRNYPKCDFWRQAQDIVPTYASLH